MWGITAADLPTILLAIVSLVLLEGLLSGDNALVLAVMVRHLPRPQQKRALRYGIWGAFLFRLIAVVFASMLLRFWQLKVAGGLYLFYLAVSHLVSGEHEEHHELKPRAGRGFWGTVINVEIADVAFSIDSILAAVALAEGLPQNLQHNHNLVLAIVYVGGVIGIVMMRLVAGVFLVLLDRFKGLAAGAYYLVGWIGVKLTESGLYQALHPKQLVNGRWVPMPIPPGSWVNRVPAWVRDIPELPDWLFWAGMGIIVVASLLYRPKGGEGHGREAPDREAPASPNGSEPHSSEAGVDAAEKT